MTDRKLMQQAIEAMEYADACLKKQLTTKTKHEYAQDLLMEAGTALRERLAQPEQEPVAWGVFDGPNLHDVNFTGSLGIGTPPDASAPVMGEPVERIRFIMSNQEPEAHVFAHPTTEWARVDKDLNVTHLDMELCAKGPQNVYTALALAIWNKAIAHEREACAKVCDVLAVHPEYASDITKVAAQAIRARGEK